MALRNQPNLRIWREWPPGAGGEAAVRGPSHPYIGEPRAIQVLEGDPFIGYGLTAKLEQHTCPGVARRADRREFARACREAPRVRPL